MELPILRLADLLVTSLPDEIDDQGAVALQQRLAEAVFERPTKGLILDVSAMRIIDSFGARILAELAQMAALLGARTVVVGVRAEVAITLTELGFDLPEVETALDLERGLGLFGYAGLGASDVGAAAGPGDPRGARR